MVAQAQTALAVSTQAQAQSNAGASVTTQSAPVVSSQIQSTPAVSVPSAEAAQSSTPVQVKDQEYSPPGTLARTPEMEARFKELAAELRCLVCQNQSLADSQAGLAEDLKAKVYQQIASGKSDADIKTYMVERYGEFILYKPAYSAGNIALWIGPFVILLIAVIAARSWLKANSAKPSPQQLISDSGQDKVREDLEKLYRKSSQRQVE